MMMIRKCYVPIILAPKQINFHEKKSQKKKCSHFKCIQKHYTYIYVM